MNKNDSNRKLILSQEYSLKASNDNAFLINIRNGKFFTLSPNQYQFFLLLDGCKSLKDIEEIYNNNSKNNLIIFIKKCFSLNIIKHNHNNIIRRFPQKTKEDHLMSVHWEITNRCNLKCRHCYQERYFENDEIELKSEKIFRIIDELALLNVLKISLSGGEPFLRPDFFEIIEYIEKKDIRVMGIYTNGISTTREMINKIKTFKSDINLFISLDGIDPQSMRLRFPSNSAFFNNMPKIFNTIDCARDLAIPITIITVLHKKNIDNLKKFYSWLKTKGIQRWRICLPIEIGRYEKNKHDFSIPINHRLNKSYEIIKEYLDDVAKLEKNLDLEIQGLFRLKTFNKLNINTFNNKNYCCDFDGLNINTFNNKNYCCDYDGKRNHICIKPNGDIVPCATWLIDPVGNVAKNSIHDIWHCKKMESFKNIKIGDVKSCPSCSYLKYCGSGCRVQSLINTNELYERDELACIHAKFMVKKIIPLVEAYFPIYAKEGS